MTPEIQSSFIPKQALVKDLRPRSEPFGLFFLLSLVILLIALLFFGGVFVYKNMLAAEINRPCPSADPTSVAGCGLLASIDVHRRAIEEDQILAIERLDKQLKRAQTMLDDHRTFLPIFKFLEEQTLQSVRYTSLNQTGANLTLRGQARDYEGVARQSIVLMAADREVEDFVFSDLSADATGRVSFNLKLDLNPKLLSDSETLIQTLP